MHLSPNAHFIAWARRSRSPKRRSPDRVDAARNVGPLLVLVGLEIVLGGGEPLEVGDELLVAEHLPVGLGDHLGQELWLGRARPPSLRRCCISLGCDPLRARQGRVLISRRPLAPQGALRALHVVGERRELDVLLALDSRDAPTLGSSAAGRDGQCLTNLLHLRRPKLRNPLDQHRLWDRTDVVDAEGRR